MFLFRAGSYWCPPILTFNALKIALLIAAAEILNRPRVVGASGKLL
jgi:hypothetical protein